MDKVKIVDNVANVAKFGTSLFGGACAGFVVDKVLEELIPKQTKLPMKLATIVGSGMLSSALANVSVSSVVESIDAIADSMKVLFAIEEAVECFDGEWEDEDAGSVRPDDVVGGDQDQEGGPCTD